MTNSSQNPSAIKKTIATKQVELRRLSNMLKTYMEQGETKTQG